MARASPSCWVRLVEPSMSVKRMVRNAVSTYGSPGGCSTMPPMKRSTIALVDLDDLVRHEPVRGAVDRLDRIGVGRLRQAERGLALLVEPVGEEPDAEPVLDLEVLEVRGCRVRGREAGELVTIHEERHRRRMPQRPCPRNVALRALLVGYHN